MSRLKIALSLSAWLVQSHLSPLPLAQANISPPPQTENILKFIPQANPLKNSYIVVFDTKKVAELYATDPSSEAIKAYIGELAEETSEKYSGKITHVYKESIAGFSLSTSKEEALRLSQEEFVAYVEEDSLMHASAGEQVNATQGLDRIDQRNLPLDQIYRFSSSGSGVNVFVLDTGIRATHSEFGGRAQAAFDAVGDGRNGADCNGHGTHVAGTIAGRTFGVAKDARIFAVRVLNCEGQGSVAGIIAGIDFVTGRKSFPAVANMSLGGSLSRALDDAVTRSIAAGISYAVAAGNDAVDACQNSPARVPSALTVGSSTVRDSRSSFSNFGACLDLFAPGSAITSASIASNTATATLSGTSMASPHVAGVAALFLEANSTASPAQVATALQAAATPNLLTGIGTGSPNLLLFAQVLPQDQPQPDPCTDCKVFSGLITNVGARRFEPNGTHYHAAVSGLHQGFLRGPANANFDLTLFRWNGSTWVAVARSENADSNEELSFAGTPGFYVWQIQSRTGSGSYSFWLASP